MFGALDFANRALQREGWARAKLADHAGRTVCVEIGPARRAFAIDTGGWLQESHAAPDLKLTIPSLQLPTLLAEPGRWGELVTSEGDGALAATLRELALTLPWFVEDMFAKAFGAGGGQVLADLGRRLLALPGYAAQRFGDSVATYVGDEARLAVSAAEARVVASEIAALVAQVDALAQRIDALDGATRRVTAGSPPAKAMGRNKRGAG